jgi:hypothetical protein
MNLNAYGRILLPIGAWILEGCVPEERENTYLPGRENTFFLVRGMATLKEGIGSRQ